MDEWKKNLSFILIDTLESGNIGAAARAMKNLGFSRLELVSPRNFPSDEAGWFAHGAEDILASAKVYRKLETALQEKTVIIGTTRRSGKRRGSVQPIREAAQEIRRCAENNTVAILFGREDRGLTNEEAAACSFMITIPSAPEHPSFNLAQAVLIIAYELSSSDYPIAFPPQIISHGEFSQLFERLRRIIKSAGYEAKGIRDSEDEIMSDLRRIISRAGITEREARMLHGVISQMEEGLKRQRAEERAQKTD
ncbi:MAG: RNA methyltransferase [Nitrospirales bacterium]|nr:RNA methyltransferase [Nitrospirales bacterium]